VNADESIDEIVAAVTELSKKKIGALIVLVRASGIRMAVETGTKLDAQLSRSLLVSIFNPRSPLHDGAVVVKDKVVEAARCTLPLSNLSAWEGQLLGTRHRAGLGISEQADVIVVIVSEETGMVSIAENGTLHRGLTPAVLRKELKARFTIPADRSPAAIWRLVKANS